MTALTKPRIYRVEFKRDVQATEARHLNREDWSYADRQEVEVGARKVAATHHYLFGEAGELRGTANPKGIGGCYMC